MNWNELSTKQKTKLILTLAMAALGIITFIMLMVKSNSLKEILHGIAQSNNIYNYGEYAYSVKISGTHFIVLAFPRLIACLLMLLCVLKKFSIKTFLMPLDVSLFIVPDVIFAFRDDAILNPLTSSFVLHNRMALLVLTAILGLVAAVMAWLIFRDPEGAKSKPFRLAFYAASALLVIVSFLGLLRAPSLYQIVRLLFFVVFFWNVYITDEGFNIGLLNKLLMD